jgi:hypothetical protein
MKGVKTTQLNGVVDAGLEAWLNGLHRTIVHAAVAATKRGKWDKSGSNIILATKAGLFEH